jgi:hypothetical protein
LVTLGMFHAWRSMGKHLIWWPMEGSKFGGEWGNILFGGQWKVPMFGGPWKVPNLMAFGRRKKNIFFTSFHFSPHKILLYHGFRPLLHFLPSFSLTYKLQSCISRYQIFYTFITKSILIEDFFLSLNS